MRRYAPARMERSTTTPDAFLASLPEPVRGELEALDAAIAPVFDADERVLWEGKFWGGSDQRIIGYGVWRYRGRSGAQGEWFIAGIAAQKDHLSLYVNGADDGQSLMKRHGGRLGNVKTSSGAAAFKRVADVDLAIVVELVTRARDLMAKAPR